MKKQNHPIELHRLLGGVLCLDYCNTKDGRSGKSFERLHSYLDILLWAKHTKIIDPEPAAELYKKAKSNPEEAQNIFKKALKLRESIYRTFRALAHQSEPTCEDLKLISRFYVAAVKDANLVMGNRVFTWQDTSSDSLQRILFPIVRSAVKLLKEGPLDRLGECGGLNCGWLFFDTTRNHSRRWCSLETCGNRMRMRKSRAKRSMEN